jgi:hypothetical protein
LHKSLELRVSTSHSTAYILAECETLLFEAANSNSSEIWIHFDPYPGVFALLNDHFGWLMYMRYEGDPGFSSRNPIYAGSPNTNLTYQLSNGQEDEYPASWAFPIETILHALRLFATSRTFPVEIQWFNDSGDGCTGPDDYFGIPHTDGV